MADEVISADVSALSDTELEALSEALWRATGSLPTYASRALVGLALQLREIEFERMSEFASLVSAAGDG